MQGLYTTAQVRELDRLAIQHSGQPGFNLMQTAGKSVADCILQRWPAARSILICCGRGNNGGDGYIVAALLAQAGLQVNILALSGALTAVATQAQQLAQQAGLQAQPFVAGMQLPAADLIVDAIYGTGLNGPVTGEGLAAIEAINAQQRPVVAVDIPSGLCADTGQALGAAVIASVTVTFVGLKRGFYTGSAGRYVGAIIYRDLGVPAAVFAQLQPAASLIEFADCKPDIPVRAWDMHKGRAGHVLVIGGAPGMSGAARMAGEAALRSGAGLVTIATHPIHAAWLNVNRPELMVVGINNAAELTPYLEKATVLALGPGLGQTTWGADLFKAVINFAKPMVIDADALNLLAQLKPQIKRNDWILTPHPGEAARLLHSSIEQIQSDRFSAIAQLGDLYGGVTVLKGAGSLIARDQKQLQQSPFVCAGGNPVLATAGTGDILTGTIAGLLAEGLDSLLAARLGVCVHAAAADRLLHQGGDRGWLATDLLPVIRDLLSKHDSNRDA